MIALVLLIPLLLAFWLWWPVREFSKRQRRWHIGVSVACALLLPLLGVIWRMHWLADAGNAWLQLGFGAVLVLFLLALPWVLLRDVCWLLLRGGNAAAVLHGARLNHVAIAIVAGMTALGIYNGLKPPAVHERELVLASLPKEMDGLRVAVLSDLHVSPVKAEWRTQRIVDEVMAAKPDLIVLPGDMADGQVETNTANIAPLKQLHAPYGVWVAPGNHEYYSNYNAWMSHFRQMGLGVLENQTTKLDINGRTLALSGVGDLVFYRPGTLAHGGIAPDIPGVVAVAKGSDFHVLLAHQPKQAHAAADTGAINLQISGHTHGGHILGFDRWVVAPFNYGYVRGEYRVKDMTLFVSSGAGQWDGFTARLGVPCSIDVLVLRRTPTH